MNRVNVIGMGYIGLPTALALVNGGVEVVGTDYNESLIQSLQEGRITFKEKGLEEMFQAAIKRGILFSTQYERTNTYIISVPTPYVKETKRIDAKYFISAVEQVLAICERGTILVIESTISPGTIDKHIRPIVIEKGFEIGKDIHIVHAPERILPGNMLYELQHNARTIGADSEEIGEKIKELYQSFCRAEITITDIKSAEMTKVVENTYRDINIAFANELAKICRAAGVDVYEIIQIANKHPRVNILSPGPGVGGHCISVDPWFLVGDYPELTKLISAAREVNDKMPDYVLDRILEVMQEANLNDYSKVGLYGLTYKEDVDDIRESPTLQLLSYMKGRGLSGFRVYDPYISNDIVENQVHGLDTFLDQIELVVIMVGHKEIKEHLYKLENVKILDTRRVGCGKQCYYL